VYHSLVYCLEMNVQVEQSWKKVLGDEFKKEYFKTLWGTVGSAYRSPEMNIFPPQDLIFNALNHCSFEDVKVVIIGQDPYHKEGQAHGLAFSVPDGVKIPPSLQNIYKEINTTINFEINCGIPKSGNLERWANQGVLLLNTTLTVEENKPGSHQKLGWETFTDAVVQKISNEKEHVVFLLWGKQAQEKGKHIKCGQHLVLTTSHPSLLSAHRGFLGCEHFKKTNQYLQKHKLKEIVW